MIRKALKLTGITLAVAFILFLVFFLLLVYPGVLFGEKIAYKNFVVHSGEVLDERFVRSVLDEVDAGLRTSEINDPALTHQILLGYDHTAFRGLQDAAWWIRSGNRSLSRALTFNRALPPYTSQVITFRIPDFENARLLHPETMQAASMVQLFTHEAVHSLIAARVGAQNVPSIPAWKIEGYAEYVAASPRIRSRPDYSLEESVRRILSQGISWMLDANGNLAPIRYGCVGRSTMSNETGNAGPTCYYLSRILVEFQLDIRGLTFDELMDPRISEPSTFRQLLDAYESATL